jgi:protein-glutamine gamma-glutamyltransferase
MHFHHSIPKQKLLGQFLFLLLPTMIVVWFILWNSNQYFTILSSEWNSQTLYFSVGFVLSYFIYQSRLRFLPSTFFLASLLFIIYHFLDYFAVGEFDSFFISIHFLAFTYLFIGGWLMGWGMQRVKFFPVFLSGILLLLSVYLISKTGELSVIKFMQYFSPIVFYAIYQVYAHQAFANETLFDQRFWVRFGKRLFVFFICMFLLFGGLAYFMFDEIKAKVESYGGQGKEGENQLLKQNEDGSVENNKSMGMGANNRRNKNPEPLFCAHINNYFPGSEIPNPLYLTSFHFTKFDTLTETFERDSSYLANDEFQPDPYSIPLFFTFKDSSRLLKSFGTKNRKTIDIEVYKKRLSANAFIAPSTAFWVQPITVEKDFQQEFKSAYRAKSYVSELNSAYFIYNTDNPQIINFQQQRFATLRKAKAYNTIDQKFYDYHTFFPTSTQYAPIQQLADSLAEGKTTTIDKVLAVRDYFLARNEAGERIFKYTDNPGIPGLPGSSKLMNFLFETKKGYCAYYAGATVFLLRAMKIPSRIVTGFLTVDRSDKNTGWYWFYEDQSHGWVQVYFPEYGWMDFDTTVGNEEAEQSPKPDGTPPMQPPNPILAMSGKIISVDTMEKSVVIKLNNLIFKDEEYASINERIKLNLRSARIWKDSLPISMNLLHEGDEVMGVSYSISLKSFKIEKSIKLLLQKIPNTLPIDEVYLKELKKKNEYTKKNDIQHKQKSWTYYAVFFVNILLGLIFFAFACPTLVYVYLKLKLKYVKNNTQKSFLTYRASLYLLNQFGLKRQQESTLQFAQKKIDVQYKTQFSRFMIYYLKQKYANQALSHEEADFVKSFFTIFSRQIFQSYSFKQRISAFLNLNRFIQYFYKFEN